MMINQLLSASRSMARRALPRPVTCALRARRTGVDAFIHGIPGLTPAQTRSLLGNIQRVSDSVPCGHGEEELLRVAVASVGTPKAVPGVVVECGCWQGGSSAKMSIAAGLAGRQLFVFDSFQGIPANDEGFSRTIHGQAVSFTQGDYTADIEHVRRNVANFGDLSVTTLVPGWLEDTLPTFSHPVAAAYLDVDLASSTMTCIKHLWPKLSPGGIIFSQDGHITAVLDALEDEEWWMENMQRKPPRIYGAGQNKLIYLTR